MSSILTYKQRVFNALSVKSENNLYIGIGRTTAWADENNPDSPSTLATEIEELIYIKKVGVKQLVIRNDSSPDVQVAGYGYSYVLDANAYTELAYRLYLSISIDYDDIAPTTTTFRQIGLLLDPTDSEGKLLTDIEYLVASVNSQGKLLYLNNRVVVSRDTSQSEKIEIVITY